jgi:GNAT superfamily N-acetyltransferase
MRLLRKLLGRAEPVPQAPGPPQLRMLASFQDKTLPAADLPDGFAFVEYHRSMDPAWISLLNSSGEFGSIDARTLKREILSIMIPGGASFITRDGQLIACATAAYAPRFSPHSLLNYVLVRSDCRGMGLGRAASIDAMRRAAARGYPGMVLQTDDTRDSAIAMYLALGFEPVLDASPDAAARWRTVMDRLASR